MIQILKYFKVGFEILILYPLYVDFNQHFNTYKHYNKSWFIDKKTKPKTNFFTFGQFDHLVILDKSI
jgi:hypothetical protein